MLLSSSHGTTEETSVEEQHNNRKGKIYGNVDLSIFCFILFFLFAIFSFRNGIIIIIIISFSILGGIYVWQTKIWSLLNVKRGCKLMNDEKFLQWCRKQGSKLNFVIRCMRWIDTWLLYVLEELWYNGDFWKLLGGNGGSEKW